MWMVKKKWEVIKDDLTLDQIFKKNITPGEENKELNVEIEDRTPKHSARQFLSYLRGPKS